MRKRRSHSRFCRTLSVACLPLLLGCGGTGAEEEARGGQEEAGSTAAGPPTAVWDAVATTSVAQAEEDTLAIPALLTVLDSLPAGVQLALEPWKGDLPEMAQRRVVRLLTVHEPMFFGFDGRRKSGLVAEAAAELEKFLNRKLGSHQLKVVVVIQPVSRDLLIPFLEEGRGDIAAAGLTITPERLEWVDFTRPLQTGVSEIVVTGPGTGGNIPARIEDLSSLVLHVRPSSSYWESLQELDGRLREQGLPELDIVAADEMLADEDLLEQVNAGNSPAIVVDGYQAEFWAQIFPEVRLHHGLAVRTDGEVAWAIRKNSPVLKDALNEFLRDYRRGTLTGNILLKRYTQDTARVQRVRRAETSERFRRLRSSFQEHAETYDLDWLLLVAQAFQESRLGQDTENRHGAVGIMQIKPASAAEAGVLDISTDDSNIEAGAAYLRLLMDRYFDDPALDPTTRQLFAIAGYNAGPSRIRSLRRRTAAAGLDPNSWFDDVEVLVAREVGREPIRYVSNIMKYYVTFTLMAEERQLEESRGL
ncbi:MAG: transporter substrate-binding domain-containing protein [marine benthic group bacterium]|nr:transporter substrate-binding domain-containing protein [Candidatus Benthicola marisminoris]